YGMRIVQSEGALFSERIDPQRWPSVQKRLKRARADWVRVGALVIGSTPVKFERVYRSCEEPVELLGRELRALQAPPRTPNGRSRPIASSAGWRPQKKLRRYERVAWLTV